MDPKILLILATSFLGLFFLGIVIFWVLPMLKGKKSDGMGMGSRNSLKEEAFPDQRAKPRDVSTSELTLEKKLKYAQWTMPIALFHTLQILISIVACFVVSLKFNIVLTLCSLYTGPLVMHGLLKTFMNKRFNRFNRDYAAFLMSLTSLLKTGMNAMTALSSAADSLDEESLVREEVVLMMERLKFGVAEEKSIGSFAEDVYHPEIELFVQALILSRREGGSLADTLDRLSKQVRKREQFRASANAAVGMQRGSIWFILAIMVGLEVYLYFIYPQAIVDSVADEVGWQVWQVGILFILIGMKWVRSVTEIRV